MVRFSCFNSPIHFHKPKKAGQPSIDSMNKAVLNHSQNQDLKNSYSFTDKEAKSVKDYHFNNSNSNEPYGKSIIESEALDHQLGGLKKSQSMGSMLGDGVSISDPHKIDTASEAFHLSSYPANNDSVFSICDQPQLDKESDKIDYSPYNESVNGSVKHTPCDLPRITKSLSVPNFSSFSPASEQSRSRSCKDLSLVDSRYKDMFTNDVDFRETREQAKDDYALKTEESNVEDVLDDNYDYYSGSGIAKDWIIPTADIDFQSESCVSGLEELPGKDFKVKRIEEWVSGIQHCIPPEETNEFLIPVNQEKGESRMTTSRVSGKDTKITAGLEFAKRYISSLNAAAATAQLANHGLVVIPLLGAFVSLKVLNLSGNSIEKMTTGSLPRGLHILNLSKNKISVIEGLRELTRLRVIDLSYNRIVRLGHGLSSCSSLKELYLAGNKISEVEGLHRLLKLTVLDLRFNKISTAKSLGQLAANYTSLQAISVEGNPAQKNVGDDQLKKYLQSLLPHLAYYNRQDMKANTIKDVADRSVRLGISGPPIERGLRQDHKISRKSGHALSSHRGSSSSTHGHRSQAASPSPVRTKARHGRLPPSGTKVNTYNMNQYLDFSRKLKELRLDNSMRRSRSEGTLGGVV